MVGENFKDNGFDQALSLLRSQFGYEEFRPGQGELVSAILQGRDCVGVMPTGAGKSICYQVPALALAFAESFGGPRGAAGDSARNGNGAHAGADASPDADANLSAGLFADASASAGSNLGAHADENPNPGASANVKAHDDLAFHACATLTLVISPLVSLMSDQVMALKSAGIPAAFLNSQLTPRQQEEVLSRARAGAYALMYVAPERLDDPRFLDFVGAQPSPPMPSADVAPSAASQAARLGGCGGSEDCLSERSERVPQLPRPEGRAVSPRRAEGATSADGMGGDVQPSRIPIPLVAVDEAHCVSQWGQDFRPSYLGISRFIAKLPTRPTVAAFTATATPRVAADIKRLLELRDPLNVTTGFDRPNLRFEVEQLTDKKKLARVVHRALANPGDSGIVYCSTRKDVERVHEALLAAGVPATRYHAGLSNGERDANQRAFVNDDAPVIVATNAFGMGIDKSNVRYVVHFNMPGSLEAYYQEAGRAGRDGEPSDCVLMWNDSDIATCRFFIEQESGNDALSFEEQQTVRASQRRRLAAMANYCMTCDCLRATILRYFGEGIGWQEVGVRRETVAQLGMVAQPGMAAQLGEPAQPGVTAQPGMAAQPGMRLGSETVLGVEAQVGMAAQLGESINRQEAGVQRETASQPGVTAQPGMAAQLGEPAQPGAPSGSGTALGVEAQVGEAVQLGDCPETGTETRSGAFNCGNCSNCTGEVDTVDVTKTARSVMRCVHELRGRFGKTIVCDVLCGSKSAKVREYGLDRKKTYDIVDDSAATVKEIIELLTAGEYLEISEGRYPLVGLGPRAREAATDEFRLYMKRHRKPSESKRTSSRRTAGLAGSGIGLGLGLGTGAGAGAGRGRGMGVGLSASASIGASAGTDLGSNLGADMGQGSSTSMGASAAPGAGARATADFRASSSARDETAMANATPALSAEDQQALFEHLRKLRKRLAEEEGMPPYIVFSDATLRAMCAAFPTTEDEFLAVNGVGPAKLKRYGTAFLTEIKAFKLTESQPISSGE